jgi:hypothetical protein
MKVKYNFIKYPLSRGVAAVLLFLLAVSQLHGQSFNYKPLTRGKLWAHIWNTSAVGQPTLGGYEFYKFDYPGHLLGADQGDHYGMCEWSGYMAWADVDGVGIPFRVCMAYDPSPIHISAIENTRLIKNYNMQDPSLLAEEIVTGANVMNRYGVEMHFRAMAWSYPKYDDFIIFEYVFKNTGTAQITNFRFAPTAELSIAHPSGFGGAWRDDDDYEWDIDHQAFYFHDGRLWDSEQDQYVDYQYGLTRSDLGDPADLGAPASINHEFLSPQYFTYYWLEKPVKSDPNEPDHMNIVDKANLNQQWNRVQDDPLNDNPEVDFDPDDYILTALTYDQPPPTETEDGTPIPEGREPTDFEHQLDYIYSTGPYDIPPGAEIKFVMVAACGMMDFERVAAGGTENEAHLKDGADSLWKNVDAAMELYQRGYEAPDPPPTPTNGMNSLILTPITGGIKIQWPEIPDSYLDPDYLINDFAGYRIYQSTFRNVGPWKRIADIPKDEAVIEDGLVTYYEEDLNEGVGYYYGVTTYDTGHDDPWPGDPSLTSLPSLESGLVNANAEPVYPAAATSNNLGDIRVYPNPFRQHSRLQGEGEAYRIEFVNIPAKCTIRIYTLAGDLVQTIEHNDGTGDEAWGSRALGDYQVNRFLQYVAPGVYLFHVESHVPGHKGESKVGKFVIIK